MTPLPVIDQVRARQERDIVLSIRRKLKTADLVLRESDKGGNLYVGRTSYFAQKAAEYRTKTGAYEQLSSNPIEEMLARVTRLLNDLHMKTKEINAKQYKEMMPSRSKVELAYMYFNPKTHKEPMSLRPIMNTIHASTRGISHLLDRLIRPLFDRHARPRPIVDSGHLLRQLEQYAHAGHLKPSTLFCTFDITNLYTMLPQDESLDILEEFLRAHHYVHVQGITIKTLRRLAEVVLKETVFVDGNQFYRQIIGGAMGSPFTLTLANIFMWKWERSTMATTLAPNEIYGRSVIDAHGMDERNGSFVHFVRSFFSSSCFSYIDDVFFTSNESKANVEALLLRANCFHPNIKLEASIGQCVTFLDLLVSNNHGTLSSSVYHKPAAEPCVVPFMSDHPRHVFANVVRAALVRAVRYSSTLDTFHKERRAIRLMLLYNG